MGPSHWSLVGHIPDIVSGCFAWSRGWVTLIGGTHPVM